MQDRCAVMFHKPLSVGKEKKKPGREESGKGVQGEERGSFILI